MNLKQLLNEFSWVIVSLTKAQGNLQKRNEYNSILKKKDSMLNKIVSMYDYDYDRSRRITPSNVSYLRPNEVFVFGSNLAGRHGRGAAKTAVKWGAIYEQSQGIQGRTYAIPTKNENVNNTLSIDEIQKYVNDFINYAKENPDKIFLVTEIGCGLAGLNARQVAPLFSKAVYISNIYLPKSFWNILRLNYESTEL